MIQIRKDDLVILEVVKHYLMKSKTKHLKEGTTYDYIPSEVAHRLGLSIGKIRKMFRILEVEGYVKSIKAKNSAYTIGPSDLPKNYTSSKKILKIDGEWVLDSKEQYRNAQNPTVYTTRVGKLLNTNQYNTNQYGYGYKIKRTPSKNDKEKVFQKIKQDLIKINWDEIVYKLIKMPVEEEEIIEKIPKIPTCQKCGQEIKFTTRNGKKISKHSGKECRNIMTSLIINS